MDFLQLFANMLRERQAPAPSPFDIWRYETPESIFEILATGQVISTDSGPDYPGQPIHHAASSGAAYSVMDFLLQLHADPNATDHNGNTPLHLYAQYGNNPKVVDLLVDRGADPTIVNNRGEEPTITAIRYHNGPIADALSVYFATDIPPQLRRHLSYEPPILPPGTYLWDYGPTQRQQVIAEYERQNAHERRGGVPYIMLSEPPKTDNNIIMMWQRVLGAEMDSPYYWGNRGYMAELLQQEDRYEKCLENAISIAPDHPQNYITLGHMKSQLFQREDALEYFNAAIRIDNTRADAYDLRATVLLALDEPSQAIHDLRQAIRLGPVDPAGCYIKMAECYARGDNRNAARVALGKALEINPNHPRANLMADQI